MHTVNISHATRRDLSSKKKNIPQSPTGWQRFIWLGPSFLWMLSAAGSGEVLFTPRIASLYGYPLLWALIAAVTLKWFINREVGRYTVCTGKSIIFGFHTLPGPFNWAIWLILIPQLVVAVATIAGMSGAAANALVVMTGGSLSYITTALIVVTGFIVLFGKYKFVEMIASICGVALSLAVMVAAISIFPDGKKMFEGMIPSLPEAVRYDEVLPWLGFMLAGAAGLMWYSNWVQARGYGAARQNENMHDPGKLDEHDIHRLSKWLQQMTLSNTLAVIGAAVIAAAFLILGTELLQPEKLVPKEDQMSQVLGDLLGKIWGPIGFWFMIIAVFITFWTTTLTNQDGWGRMFTTGTKILLEQFSMKGQWTSEAVLRKFYTVFLLIVFPAVLYLLIGKPVSLLKVAGAIEAAHIPIVAGLTLYLNHKNLPRQLRPSLFSFGATAFAGVFFILFAVFYLLQLTGLT